MKWVLGVLSALLLFNVLAQQQTINDLRSELKKASADTLAPLPASTPTDSAAPTGSASTTPQTKRPVPKINWTGDVATCNKNDKTHDWWIFTHVYLSDPVKYASYRV